MDPRYDHTQHENKIYQLWLDQDCFAPTTDPDAQPYTIIMPPPNANDSLHVGHAMFVSLEDTIIRFERMRGKAALWLPGTDHAGIETQFVFEKKLSKEGKSRFDYDRESLFKLIWDYVAQNSDIAVDQIKRLGASADWSRFKFTLDPNIVNTVLETFTKLHNDGLVYRDVRLVSYCTKCGTAFSELEVVHQDQVTNLYYVRYPLADNPKEFVTLATTRPEPIFVDTHLAVHPDNPKTKHLIGRQVLNPLTQAPMTIIADEFVDPEFGTGIVKLTPAHDAADFEVAKRHGLPIIPAITTQGRIVADAPVLSGLKVDAARSQAVELLEQAGLIDKIDTKYHNRVGTCYRCGRVLEPLPLPQFFIKVEPLTRPIIDKLDAGKFKVIGSGHDKILRHWLENLKDWNISRQIVWGIRLPVWYQIGDQKTKTNHLIQVTFLDKDKQLIRGALGQLLTKYKLSDIKSGLQSLDAPVDATFVISPDSPGEDYLRETDTFDTWFSSAQWPFVTLINNKEDDFQRFYPTQLMNTGYDILPFWVMRMLMVGYYRTGKLPFSTVYLHGLVRDDKGQKMSKSKGNVTNPLVVVEKYGADALRLALMIRSSAGLDKSVGDSDFKAARNLTNKIWNATRFVLMSASQSPDSETDDSNHLKQLDTIVAEATRLMTKHKLGMAADVITNHFWHWYCDEQIEAFKQNKISSQALIQGLLTFLKLMHPFVPYVTEAAYQQLRQEPTLGSTPLLDSPTLIKSAWPAVKHD